ncbi:MAG: hypothetical protein DRH26_04230 [Deltaproteobacteria bacterium]|nr:MAG: hypothetical protein DRH26_04230 [Deltaproteobacteria bacterium]
MIIRTQTQSQVTWSAAVTKSIPADGVFVESDDFTVDSDMIAIGFSVTGVSAGSTSNDVLDIHCQVKRDPNNSNSGVPDSYDTSKTFQLSLDCSDGLDNQESEILEKVMAGDTIRFVAANNGTNAITIGVQVTEDTLTF